MSSRKGTKQRSNLEQKARVMLADRPVPFTPKCSAGKVTSLMKTGLVHATTWGCTSKRARAYAVENCEREGVIINLRQRNVRFVLGGSRRHEVVCYGVEAQVHLGRSALEEVEIESGGEELVLRVSPDVDDSGGDERTSPSKGIGASSMLPKRMQQMVKSKCARSARCKLLGCLLLLLAVRTVGRKCENDDVFPKGHFSTATIPANCTELSLRSNKIGDDGATALAEVLKNNNTALATLSLRSNKIGDDGATALAEVLKNNTALATLDLRSNKIGDDGATALAEVLKNNTALATLDLHGNKIGDDGATALAEALKNNNTALATLSLSNNKIGNDGAIALAEALKTSTALTYLVLGRNMIGRRGELALQDMLESNTALKPRHLPGSQRYTVGQQIGIVATTVANAIGKPDTFQLLGDLNVASGNHNSSNQKMIDTKYGSDDRERMMQAKVVEGYNFEFALVYQGSGVGERRVGGGGDKGGIGGAATNVYDVTGNAPMRMVSSTAV
eukprot:gene16669-5220_t